MRSTACIWLATSGFCCTNVCLRKTWEGRWRKLSPARGNQRALAEPSNLQTPLQTLPVRLDGNEVETPRRAAHIFLGTRPSPLRWLTGAACDSQPRDSWFSQPGRLNLVCCG